jgi:F-type H+-transporting ATPase subunit delta
MKDSSQVDLIVRGILDYLTSIKSLDLLPAIARRLEAESWIKVDPDLAQVYSRVKLSEKEISQISRRLSGYFQRPIRVETAIDPEIIAGLKIVVSGKTIDTTVNRRLEELKENLSYD